MSVPVPSGRPAEIPLGRDFDTKRPVGYIANYRPHKKTQIMLARIEQVLAEYREHLPLTVRQVYYRMVAAYGYSKGKNFTDSLYEALVNGRRSGRIPFEHIRDDGIQGGCFWWSDAEQYRRNRAREIANYARDKQQDQPLRMQVWCEAAGMVPQLQRVADEFSVPVYSCGGFNSLTAIRQIVDACVEETTGPTAVLHLGDCDPSGDAIFDRVAADVSAFLDADARHDEQTFDAVRVALTQEQVEQHKLSWDPITTKDSRSRAWAKQGRTYKCELEALPPDEIAKLLRASIGERICRETLGRMEVEEARDRASLMRELVESDHMRNAGGLFALIQRRGLRA